MVDIRYEKVRRLIPSTSNDASRVSIPDIVPLVVGEDGV